ncbi:NUDIX hydrolase [Yinghuangia seranimata]|uniref:NUDIX hydrolase n=1 Tax=Yinghuangia seranimata TaxID=408067 RepID=UPI00248CCDF1|nr:NUDIX hydrolase [Yinghuangia seranimata]MDI2129427.1 NUDIX hydrolase [Yinghuangia seranimata]
MNASDPTDEIADVDDAARARRKAARLAAYEVLRDARPEMFANPAGAEIEILPDPEDQARVSHETSEALVAFGFPEEGGDIGVVYHDPYFRLVRDAVRFPSGRTGTYIRLVSDPGAVGAAVLPVLTDGRIVLLRHFRHAERDWRWEIPRGFGAFGEDGRTTAGRELREELGCEADELVYLGAMSADSGMRAGHDELYLARIDAAALPVHPEVEAREEGISGFRLLAAAEFRDLLVDGVVTDAYTLSAYGLAVARGLLSLPRVGS